MSQYIGIFFFLLLPLFLFGNKGARYLSEIKNRHELLAEGGQHFFDGKIDLAEAAYQEAIQLFTKKEDIKLASIANMAYALCLREQGQIHEAIPYLEKAYQLAKKSKELLTYKGAMMALNQAYKSEGKYHKAIALQRETIQQYSKRKRTRQYEAELRVMATLLIKVSAFDSAKVYIEQALQLAEKSENKNRIALAHALFSNYYQAMNNYDSAIFYRLEQLKHLESTGLTNKFLVYAKQKIANIYVLTEDWDKAAEYAESAMELAEILDLRVAKAEILTILGAIAAQRGEKTDALKYYQEMLALLRPTHKTPLIIRTLHEIGTIFQREKQYLRADSCFVEALDLAKNHQDQNFQYPLSLSKLGLLKMEQEQYQAAIPILEAAAREAYSFSALNVYQKVNKALAEAYQQQGKFSVAFQHLQIAYSVKDSLFTIEKEELTQETNAKYELAKKEKALAELNLENEMTAIDLFESQKQQQFYGFGLLVLIGTLLLIFQLYQQKKKSNAQMSGVNTSLSQSLVEKEFLLKEIHHRVKNNLQIISSMLSLQSDKITDPTTLGLIREGQNRVESMVLIHEYLYKSENLSMIDCKEYIERLTSNLVQSYQVNPTKIELIKDIDPIPMKPDKVISLGLIINELISNALKYAFANHTDGKLTIALKNNSNGIQLMVKDNGIGMPQFINLKNSQTLGFQLIYGFVKKLKANINIQKIGGTEVIIDIPKDT